MADLLVIVPSRGRPEPVPRLLEAWDATGAWESAVLAIAVDVDDPQIGAYRRHATERVGDGKHWWLRDLSRWRPMVSKLNEVASAEAGNYWALAFAGDDHLPRTQGWAGRYLDELRDLGTGIVYGNDQVQGERLPTQWAMTSDIVRALGRMVPADVEHLYCDNAVLDLGRAAGCIRYLPDVVIEHCHPLAGRGAWDTGYARVNSRGQYARDHAAYRRWRTGMAADVGAVMSLRDLQQAPPVHRR